MRNSNLLLIASLFLLPPMVFGFSEDLCRQDDGNGNFTFVNCLDSDCDPSNPDAVLARCRANILWDAALTSALENGRSMVHVDSVFYIAQALGIRWDVAYWLAAYNEVTDIAQYVPIGRDAQLLESQTEWHSILLNGWQRTSGETGGISLHFVAPFLPSGETQLPPTVDGVHPDLSDIQHEGMLAHIRSWALSERDPCSDGLTSLSTDLTYFTGTTCYRHDPRLTTDPAAVSHNIEGDIPVLSNLQVSIPFQAYSGNQIARFTPPVDLIGCKQGTTTDPNDCYIHDIQYATELQALLDAGTGKLMDGQPVPPEVARTGIYLHILQDRISHSACGDASTVSGPSLPGGLFTYDYGKTDCAQDVHAWRHYEEIGLQSLPERSFSALSYAWDTLEDFIDANSTAHPQWFTTPTGLTKAEVVGSQASPGILMQALTISDATARLNAFLQANTNAGFRQMPGNDPAAPSTSLPPWFMGLLILATTAVLASKAGFTA